MSTLLLVVCCLGVGCVAGKRVIREEKNRKERREEIGLCCCALRTAICMNLSELGEKADYEDEERGDE